MNKHYIDRNEWLDKLNEKWPKPSPCQGCSLLHSGAGFARSSGSGRNGIALLGSQLDETGAEKGLPFQGEAGTMLTRVLHRMGLKKDDFLLLNLISCNTPFNREPTVQEIDKCSHYLNETLAQNPQIKVVMPMGPIALQALLGVDSVYHFHGTVHWHTQLKRWIVPTFDAHHLISTESKEVLTTISDFNRAFEVLKNGYEEPVVSFIEYPTAKTALGFVEEYEAALTNSNFTGDGDVLLSVDIETPYSADIDEEEKDGKDSSWTIDRISFSYRRAHAITMPWVEPFIGLSKRLLASSGAKIFWNGNKFDVPRLQHHDANPCGVVVDGMDAFHFLYSDIPKGLGYATPMLTLYKPWKHLSGSNMPFYSCMDAVTALENVLEIKKRLEKAGTWHVFMRDFVGIEPTFRAMTTTGIGIDSGKRQELREYYINLRDNSNEIIQKLMPAECKPLLKKGGYKGKPKDVRLLVASGTPIDQAWSELGYFRDTDTTWNKRVEFNANSGTQIKQYIGWKYGLDAIPKNKKTGKLTVGNEELERLAKQKNDKILFTIIDSSSAGDKLSGILDNWPIGADGRVHPTFTNNAATFRLSSVRPNCFSADTEVLTARGWVFWPETTAADLFAQYDEQTGVIDFILPLHYIKEWFTGQLVNNKSEFHIDLLTTEDHNCLLRNRRSGNLKRFKAKDYPQDKEQIQAGQYVGGWRSHTEAELILLAALQADGSVTKYGHLDWKFTKQRKIKRLEQALVDREIPYKKLISPSGTRFRVNTRDVPVWLRKDFGPWILDLNQESFNFLAEEIWFWDGYYASRTMYSSSRKNDADWGHILTILSGRRAKLREYIAASGNINWQVDAGNVEYVLTTNTVRSRVPYNDYVYCVCMPKQTVIVRRNGRVAITGQSQNFPNRSEELNKLREMVIGGASQDDDWWIVSGDYSGIEAIEVGWYAQDFDYMRLAKFGIHSYVAGIKMGMDINPKWDDDQLKMALGEAKKRAKAQVVESGASLYDAVKRGIHGTNYLMTDYLLHETYPDLFATRTLAKAFQQEYREICPSVKPWQDSVIDMAYDQCCVVNDFGYRRWFWDVKRWQYDKRTDEFKLVPSGDAKKVVATLPQGSAAAIIRRAMLRQGWQTLCNEGKGMIQIHDDLTARAHKHELDRVIGLLRDTMTFAVEEQGGLVIPLAIKIGKNWRDQSPDNKDGMREVY